MLRVTDKTVLQLLKLPLPDRVVAFVKTVIESTQDEALKAQYSALLVDVTRAFSKED